jgi:hypothetical protein
MQFIKLPTVRRLTLTMALSAGVGALMGACGGADGGEPPTSAQQAINRDAMGRIDGERADREVLKTQ